MARCDRCPKPLGLHRVSWFNLDTICTRCQAQEEAHPDFAYARAVERQRVTDGDFNYVGVGWPGADGRVLRTR